MKKLLQRVAHAVKRRVPNKASTLGAEAVVLAWYHTKAGKSIPGAVLDAALLQLLPPVFSQREPPPRYCPSNPPIVDGRIGTKVHGNYTIDSEVLLPRMVRTKDGREMLHHELVREKADAAAPASG